MLVARSIWATDGTSGYELWEERRDHRWDRHAQRHPMQGILDHSVIFN